MTAPAQAHGRPARDHPESRSPAPEAEGKPRVDGDWERSLPTARQQRWDLGIGLLLGVGAVLSAVLARSAGFGSDEYRPSQGEEIAWAMAVTLPLCLRRRYPLAVLVTCSIAFIGMQARFVSESTMSSIALFAALYTAGAWGRNRRITTAVRLLVIVVMFCWLAYAISDIVWNGTDRFESMEDTGLLPPRAATVLYTTAINILFFAAAWVFGNSAWTQSKQSAELAERNQELKDERDANARRAVIAERVRIARELHDVVAHHVSIMGVQAGAARRVLERDPALAERTLTSIEQAGRSAVEEMHRLLGVLREGEPEAGPTSDRSPAPDLDQLEDLVTHARDTVPTATLTVVGEPQPIPQSISVSLYRITQEALTNTMRHAGASRVDVRLRYLEAGVEVEVVDDGRGRTSADQHRTGTAERTSGMGHVGMRERIAMHDGQLEVGPRPDGGYRVRARFPL